jgi:D-alanyl-D-alanine carboxypeptidase (penicillin-binding protein 5/6)
MRGLLRGRSQILAVLLALLAPLGAAAETPQTSVPHVILVDAATGTVLFEKGADDPVTPASTVKIMTAELVFEALASGKLALTDALPVSEAAWRQGGAPSHGSSMFAVLNSRVPVEDLIRGLVIDSGNDAAIVLAEGIAGSEGAFATRMTTRARELGLTHSTFTSAWGRADPEQKVSARDMAVLAAHLIATYPAYYKYFAERDFTWNKIHQTNRNPLLAMDLGADGLKTGNIDASGYGLVGSAVQNGQRLILVIYGAATAKERAEEARRILQWGFRSFETRQVFKPGEIVGRARVYGGAAGSVDLVADRAVTLLVPRDATERLSGRIVYTGPLIAPVAADAPVGHLKISRGALEVLDVPLRTAADVPVGSLPRRAMDAGLEYVGGVVRGYIAKR